MGVRFKRIIMDEGGLSPKSRAPKPPQEPGYKRLVFCSGKVYYELAAERERQGKQDEVAIVRIEQLAPFPFDLVSREMRRCGGKATGRGAAVQPGNSLRSSNAGAQHFCTI